VRMPSHRWFSQPVALDSAVGAGTIGGNTLTGTVPSDLNSVHTDSAPVHIDSAQVHTDFAPVSLITQFGGRRRDICLENSAVDAASRRKRWASMTRTSARRMAQSCQLIGATANTADGSSTMLVRSHAQNAASWPLSSLGDDTRKHVDEPRRDRGNPA
jgi:hypothetical protein